MRSGDGLVKSPYAAFRCSLRHCGVQQSTPHSSGFARLAYGAFYETVSRLGRRKFYSVISVIMLLSVALCAGCGGTMDDLDPSGTDKRPAVQAGTTGPAVGQLAPGFTLADSLGKSVSLSSVLAASKGVVLYFTMWCPTCDIHMSNMRSNVVPSFPDVRFFLVDYVSGSVADARNAQVSNGYDGPEFTVLADTGHSAQSAYEATMGTTVVIDAAGVIRMNEDYKDGVRLKEVLGGLK